MMAECNEVTSKIDKTVAMVSKILQEGGDADCAGIKICTGNAPVLHAVSRYNIINYS